MSKKILLITPDFNPDDALERGLSSKLGPTFMMTKAFMAPLGLATVAALTPDDIDVDIWDEAVHGLVTDATRFDKDYDLVGVTGYAVHIGRVTELGRIFRQRHIPVAVGGPGVSAEPELYRDRFDILFIGEAEYTWPKFISDWKTGSYRHEYRQVGKVDMVSSPLPRWDKVAGQMQDYLMAGVQTTRGCPFDCEFCDVIYLYGRQARHKSVDQVVEEIRLLERLGAEFVFLCDDNFIGNPRYAKDLLKALVTLNRSFPYPLGLYTQLTLNVAKNEEMLSLLADANFVGVFVGIETPNIDSLVETNKPQNYRTDIVADVQKIHRYGLVIQAGMIVGFDHDDASIFERQLRFLQEAGIPNPVLNTLKAPTGTKLWGRMHKEGRIVAGSYHGPGVDRGNDAAVAIGHATNIIPKLMSRVELMAGYGRLVRQVRDWRNFEERLTRMIAQVQYRPDIKPRRRWALALKLIRFVFFSMDRAARATTLRVLLYTLRRAPFMLERAFVQIWRQYVEAAQVPTLLEEIEQQIRRETAEGTKLPRAPIVFFVPEAFKKPYRDLFAELYRRVRRGLIDGSRTHDALVEVTCDFLTRWGPTFERFADHHRAFLYELCDRAIAKENSRIDTGVGLGPGAGRAADEIADFSDRHGAAELKRLTDDVFRAVEQELRNFQPAASPA